MTRRRALLVAAAAALLCGGCASLPTVAPPPTATPVTSAAPTTSPAPTTPDASLPPSVSTPAPAPTAAGGDVVDCALDASPVIMETAAHVSVVGECEDVTIMSAEVVDVEHAESVLVNGSDVDVTIGEAGEVTVNGSGLVVRIDTAATLDLNGTGCEVHAEVITDAVGVNGIEHVVEWSDGVAEAAATVNGFDHEIDGP